MSNWRVIIFLIVLLLLQISFVNWFPAYGVLPNLILLSLVWMAFMYPMKISVITAITGGLILDCYAGTVFGIHLLSLLAIVIILDALITAIIPKEENTFIILVILLPVLAVVHLLMFGTEWLLQLSVDNSAPQISEYFNWEFLAYLGYSYLLFFPITWLTKKLLGRTYEQKPF